MALTISPNVHEHGIITFFDNAIKQRGWLSIEEIELLNNCARLHCKIAECASVRLRTYLTLPTWNHLLLSQNDFWMLTIQTLTDHPALIHTCITNYYRFQQSVHSNSKCKKLVVGSGINNPECLSIVVDSLFSTPEIFLLKDIDWSLQPLRDAITTRIVDMLSDISPIQPFPNTRTNRGIVFLYSVKRASIKFPVDIQKHLVPVHAEVFDTLYEPSDDVKTMHKAIWTI